MAKNISLEINYPDGRGVEDAKITYSDQVNGVSGYSPDFTGRGGWAKGLRFAYEGRVYVYVNGHQVGYFYPRNDTRYTFVYYGEE